MAHFFIDGGQFMYVILSLDMALLVLAIISVTVNTLKLQIVSLAAATSPLLCGYIGYEYGMIKAYSAVANADPAIKLELLEMSREFAQIPLVFGIISTIVLVILIMSRMVLKFRSKV